MFPSYSILYSLFNITAYTRYIHDRMHQLIGNQTPYVNLHTTSLTGGNSLLDIFPMSDYEIIRMYYIYRVFYTQLRGYACWCTRYGVKWLGYTNRSTLLMVKWAEGNVHGTNDTNETTTRPVHGNSKVTRVTNSYHWLRKSGKSRTRRERPVACVYQVATIPGWYSVAWLVNFILFETLNMLLNASSIAGIKQLIIEWRAA